MRTNGTVPGAEFGKSSQAEGRFCLTGRTMRVLWAADKDDAPGAASKTAAWFFGMSGPGPGGPEKVAERIIKQFRKDWEKASK